MNIYQNLARKNTVVEDYVQQRPIPYILCHPLARINLPFVKEHAHRQNDKTNGNQGNISDEAHVAKT